MSQSSLLAFHAEGGSVSELVSKVEAGLAELRKVGGASKGEPKAEKPAKEAKAEPKADSGPKITLDGIKGALTKLKTAIGGEEDEKKAGIKAVKKVLKEFGVTNSTDLKEDQYPAVMKAIEAAMPKEDEDGEEF